MEHAAQPVLISKMRPVSANQFNPLVVGSPFAVSLY